MWAGNTNVAYAPTLQGGFATSLDPPAIDKKKTYGAEEKKKEEWPDETPACSVE
jgi:hypothetical protein